MNFKNIKSSIKAISVIAMLTAMSACSTQNVGNFSNSKQANYTKDITFIADDTVNKLVTVYPPAKTQFSVTYAKDDYFHNLLISKLRQKGYAINYVQQRDGKDIVIYTDHLRLSYVLNNREKDKRNYQIVLHIKNDVLARFYSVSANNNALTTSSNWTLMR